MNAMRTKLNSLARALVLLTVWLYAVAGVGQQTNPPAPAADNTAEIIRQLQQRIGDLEEKDIVTLIPIFRRWVRTDGQVNEAEVHQIVDMLHDDLHSQPLANNRHGFLEGRQGKVLGLDLGQHDHSKKITHDGLSDVGDIDEMFGHYISLAWRNEEISKYIEALRAETKDPRYYKPFEELASRVIKRENEIRYTTK